MYLIISTKTENFSIGKSCEIYAHIYKNASKQIVYNKVWYMYDAATC